MNKALVTVLAILVVLGGVALWTRPKAVSVDLSHPNANPNLQVSTSTPTGGLPTVNLNTSVGTGSPKPSGR